jgi:2-C-methyl-D-erythritol 4-phosphate cytidylyltransferase
MQEKVLGILLAGGQGSRMEASVNKVLLPVAGIPCIARSAKALSGFTDHLILVYHAGEEAGLKSALDRFPPDCSWSLVQGGETRQESVFHGIRKAAEAYPGETVILIHDGARCLVSSEVIQSVLSSVRRHGSGIAAVPVTDTIRFASEDGRTGETVPRAGLYAMQTPQGGRLSMLLDAFEKAAQDGFLGTDDAAVLSHAGYPVYLASGSRQNLKLTVREDLAVAEALLSV